MPLLYCSFRPALFSNMGILATRVSISPPTLPSSRHPTPLVLYYYHSRTTLNSLLKPQLNRPLAFWKSGNLYSDMLKNRNEIAFAGQSIPKRLRFTSWAFLAFTTFQRVFICGLLQLLLVFYHNFENKRFFERWAGPPIAKLTFRTERTVRLYILWPTK